MSANLMADLWHMEKAMDNSIVVNLVSSVPSGVQAPEIFPEILGIIYDAMAWPHDHFLQNSFIL